MISLGFTKYSTTILLILSIILLILVSMLSSKKELFRYRQVENQAGSFEKLVSQLQHNEDKPLINNLNI